jgi:hypothetical protein
MILFISAPFHVSGRRFFIYERFGMKCLHK